MAVLKIGELNRFDLFHHKRVYGRANHDAGIVSHLNDCPDTAKHHLFVLVYQAFADVGVLDIAVLQFCPVDIFAGIEFYTDLVNDFIAPLTLDL